jgi:hypothetical protein
MGPTFRVHVAANTEFRVRFFQQLLPIGASLALPCAECHFGTVKVNLSSHRPGGLCDPSAADNFADVQSL